MGDLYKAGLVLNGRSVLINGLRPIPGLDLNTKWHELNMGIPRLGTAQTLGDKTHSGGCDLPATGRQMHGEVHFTSPYPRLA